MAEYFGEYRCKIDPKGRLHIPRDLIKQFDQQSNGRCILRRGVEEHLILQEYHEWQKFSEWSNKLQYYGSAEGRKALRLLSRGTAEVHVDGSDRILIPKNLITMGGFTKELVLMGVQNHIEIWDAAKFDAQYNDTPEDFPDLIERTLGQLPVDD